MLTKPLRLAEPVGVKVTQLLCSSFMTRLIWGAPSTASCLSPKERRLRLLCYDSCFLEPQTVLQVESMFLIRSERKQRLGDRENCGACALMLSLQLKMLRNWIRN
jgi:hypothetical protein